MPSLKKFAVCFALTITTWLGPTLAATITRFIPFTATTGGDPLAPLLEASDGNFYGTTAQGGDDGLGCTQPCNGTVFKLTKQGQLTVLHTFAYESSAAPYGNGSEPEGGLVEGPDGWLYGTTYMGGVPHSNGIVYKISKGGQFQKLYDFCSTTPCSDGANPQGSLAFGADGYLYGVTTSPIINPYLFRISTSGAYTPLFGLYNTGLGTPSNGLILGSDRNLYGLAAGGVFEITRGGALQIVHLFGTGEGFYGTGPLIEGVDGRLYGATYQGGAANVGIIFALDRDGNNYKKVLELTTAAEGQRPNGVMQTADQNLWDTTTGGGTQSGGMVFSVNTSGTLLQSASFTVDTGKLVMGSLVQASDGKLYGTASSSGPSGYGTVFIVDGGLTPPAPGEAAVSEAMVVTAYDKATGNITVSYGSACFATDHHIVYGPLSSVSTYGYNGQACSVGSHGTATFNPGTGSFFWVIVGNTPTLEGSYGKASGGGERPEAIGLPGCDYPQNLSGGCP